MGEYIPPQRHDLGLLRPADPWGVAYFHAPVMVSLAADPGTPFASAFQARFQIPCPRLGRLFSFFKAWQKEY
jgi:hypothetical protein